MGDLANFSTDYKNTFIRQIKLFDTMGFHLYVNPEYSFLRKHGKLIALSISVFLFCICQFAYFIFYRKNNVDLMELAGNVPAAILHLEDTVKLTIMILKKEQIKNVIDEIGKLLLEGVQGNDKKLNIKKKCMHKSTFLNNIFFFSTYPVCLAFFVIPLLYNLYNYMMEQHLNYYLFPFQLYYPFEVDTIFKYLVIYIWQSITTFLYHVYFNVTCDLLVVTLISNTTILFALLQLDLEHLAAPLTNVYVTKNMPNEDIHLKCLKKIVRRHQMAIRLSDKLTEIFGVIMLFVVSFKSLIVCFFGFQAVALGGLQSLINLAVTSVMLFGIFFLACPGQMLLDMSAGVGDAAYHNLWYKCDAKYRKFIILIIARSQKPCRLSALGFTDITMQTFTKMATSSYSYISLLNQMYQKE